MNGPISSVLAALAIAGCSLGGPVGAEPAATVVEESSTSEPAEAGTVVELRFDQTTTHEDLELRWLELDDSRCPIGVVCVWEGEIKVRLEAVRGEAEPVRLELTLRAGHEPRGATAHGHVLILRGVDPHPKRGVTPERGAYVARVEIGAA